MPWGLAAGAIVGGLISGEASKKAGKTAAGSQREAIAEQRRQFDVTQKQMEPWRQAGESALGRYEGMLGRQADFEGQIRSNIPGQFQYGGAVPEAYRSPTDVPDVYQSQTNVPQAYGAGAGNYFGRVQNNVRPGFQFGRQEFDQYKDPGYDFRTEEGLRALERSNAAGGKRTSGYNTRSLMELGQNLASQEFGAARNRAMQDYESGVAREGQVYGRSAQDYSRRLGRESELYGRGRTQRQDQVSREQQMYGRGLQQRGEAVSRESAQYGRGRQFNQDQVNREQQLYQRGLTGYGLGVNREQAQYNRDLSRYGRTYVDPMAREAAMANIGQTTASNLGELGAYTSKNIAGMIGQAGRYRAEGQLGAAGAYAGAMGSLGDIWNKRNQGNSSGYNYANDYQNPESQTPQYLARNQ